jgi:glycyl-tRNA synthetase (class II)
MLDTECTELTIEEVHKTSGHVDYFTDFMVKAEEEAHRVVDEAHWAVQRQVDACTGSGGEELFSKYGMKLNKGNAFSPSFLFNLMIRTLISARPWLTYALTTCRDDCKRLLWLRQKIHST